MANGQTHDYIVVAPAEREETHMVKSVFMQGGCLRKGIYESFAVSNPTGTLLFIKARVHCIFIVTYSDLAEERERCHQCFCCSVCSEKCGCVAGLDEDHDHQIYRALGTDQSDEKVVAAELKRKIFVAQEIAEIETSSSEGEGSEDELLEDNL